MSYIDLGGVIYGFSIFRSSRGLRGLVQVYLTTKVFVLVFTLFNYGIALCYEVAIVCAFNGLARIYYEVLFRLVRGLLDLFFLDLFLLVDCVVATYESACVDRNYLVHFVVEGYSLSFYCGQVVRLLLGYLGLRGYFCLVFHCHGFLGYLFAIYDRGL